MSKHSTRAKNKAIQLVQHWRVNRAQMPPCDAHGRLREQQRSTVKCISPLACETAIQRTRRVQLILRRIVSCRPLT